MYIDNIPNIGIVTSWEPYNIPLVGGEIYSVSPNQTISYIGDYSIGVCISFRYSLSSIEALDHKEIENRFSGVIPSSENIIIFQDFYGGIDFLQEDLPQDLQNQDFDNPNVVFSVTFSIAYNAAESKAYAKNIMRS